MEEVPRDNPNEKVEGLMKVSQEIFDEIKHLSYLKTFFFDFSIKRFNFLRDLSTLLALLINLAMLIGYNLEFSASSKVAKFENGEDGGFPSFLIVNILGYV